MRILHTSDWHLGQYFYGKSRQAEHQQFLNWLVEQIKEHQVDAVIVVGDIFDTGTPPSYAREMYFDFIAKIAKINCQLIILAGNHDSVAMLAEAKQLLANLAVDVVPTLVDDIKQQVLSLTDINGKIQGLVCAIPFIRPRDLLKSKARQSAKDKQQSLQQAIKDHYQATFNYALKVKNELADNNIPIIMTGHLTTVGVTSSDSVRDIYIGTLEAFAANAFPKADYIALGHIHRAQIVAKSDHIRYCGSPIPLSFDEAKQNKQVLMVDFKQGKLATITGLVVPCFQLLAIVKTSVEQLFYDVESLVSQHEVLLKQSANKMWLDIEIDSGDYLHDLHAHIAKLTENLAVEILLIRRSKKSRQLMISNEDKTTLSELTLAEVFDKRLALEDWQGDDKIAQKKRLIHLFQLAQQSLENNITELKE